MFWLRNKKNNFQLCTLIGGPGFGMANNINPDQTTPSGLCLFDQVVMTKYLESGMWIGDIWKVCAFNNVLDSTKIVVA